MGKSLVRLLQDRSGVTTIEYAAIAFFISLALVAAMRSAELHVAIVLRHAAGFMIKGHPLLSP